MSMPPPLRLLIRKDHCSAGALQFPSRRIIHSVSHKIFSLLPCCLTPFSCSGIVAESHLFRRWLWHLRLSWQEWDPEHQNSQMILACIVMGEWSSKPCTEKSDGVIDMGGGGGLIQIYFYVGKKTWRKSPQCLWLYICLHLHLEMSSSRLWTVFHLSLYPQYLA